MKAGAVFLATGLLVYFLVLRTLEWLLPFTYEGVPADVDLRGVYESVRFLKLAAFSVVIALASGSVAAYLATVPWERWRYSLRALVIMTTLVAVVLGLVVWFSRTG